MREIVFEVTAERPGHIEARAVAQGLRVEAGSLEELHHEAREALIESSGAAHVSYRILIQRPRSPGRSGRLSPQLRQQRAAIARPAPQERISRCS